MARRKVDTNTVIGSIINEAKSVRAYYNTEITWLTEQRRKLSKLGDIIEKQLDEMFKSPSASRMVKSLADLTSALVSLRGQQQSCITSLMNIKKMALEYTLKLHSKDENVDTEDEKSFMIALQNVKKEINNMYADANKLNINLDDDDSDINKKLDDAIDDALSSNLTEN